MIVLGLILLPLVAGLLVALTRARVVAGAVMAGVGLVCSALAVVELFRPGERLLVDDFLRVDPTALLFLLVVNPIFFGVAVYARHRVVTHPELATFLTRFAAASLVFLAAANVVLLANHLFVAWVALEATSLAATRLIVREGARSSRTAAWRYLLFSSVGLALVLLGIVCLGRGMEAMGREPSFYLDQATALATAAGSAWGKLGLALVILGLGTKLGLAPMYSWLPETYDEAPPATTALLAAIQFNCALVLLFRVVEVFRPTSDALITSELVLMGIVSAAVSTVGLIATRQLGRLIAYASINHAGVIAIGLGVGKGASYGLMLYVVGNAFIKAILFLTAGNITAHYRTKDTREIAGLIKDLPYSGVFLMVGTFALLGLPPFVSFLGELLILSALVSAGQLLVFAALCLLITMTFVATGRTVFPMIWGEPKRPASWARQTFWAASPKLVFLVVLVLLGVYIPSAINDLLQAAAAPLEGTP